MLRKALLATTVLALAGVPTLALAAEHDHCDGWEIIETKELYFVRGTTAEHDGYFYVYLESNGEPGLQRGGTSLLGEEDHCQASENPDTLVA